MKQPTGVVNIKGREYTTVARRVQDFRDRHPDWSLSTAILHRDLDCVVVQASIADDAGRIRATGHAEEFRKSSEINRTSALENCETSAIGRALAALGFGGTEFASADELVRAVSGQKGDASGTHNAPRMAFEALQPEVQDNLRRAAPQIVAYVGAGKVREAIDLFELTCGNWDDDTVKPALWSLLDSGTRSSIKKFQAEKEAA